MHVLSCRGGEEDTFKDGEEKTCRDGGRIHVGMGTCKGGEEDTCQGWEGGYMQGW